MPWEGYFSRTSHRLDEITHFIQSLDPDLAGLVEVDAGSYRSRQCNQAEAIAKELGHYHTYMSKYHADSFANRIPIMKQQGNAFLTRNSIANEEFHYFEKGVKRLVIELELENITVFLVHLALKFRVRHHQLQELYSLVKETKKPHIVAGDFNALWGEHEIELFQAATGLRNANTEGSPSFPSWKPKRQLDFIFHSPGVEIRRFWMPEVTYSDHLPLVCDLVV